LSLRVKQKIQKTLSLPFCGCTTIKETAAQNKPGLCHSVRSKGGKWLQKLKECSPDIYPNFSAHRISVSPASGSRPFGRAFSPFHSAKQFYTAAETAMFFSTVRLLVKTS
jgi:hypothetical protein